MQWYPGLPKFVQELHYSSRMAWSGTKRKLFSSLFHKEGGQDLLGTIIPCPVASRHYDLAFEKLQASKTALLLKLLTQ